MAVVDYGAVKLVYRLTNGVLTTYNLNRQLRFHHARAISIVPASNDPSKW
jgi:hypothetical protein